jgi:hypothetical protein
MERLGSHLIVAGLGAIALMLGVPAAATLSALEGMNNRVLASQAVDAHAICAFKTMFSGETEQILTILASSFVLGLAWLIWHRSASPHRV